MSKHQQRRTCKPDAVQTVYSILPTVITYDELRHAISQARSESRLRTEKAVENEHLLEAWQIGRLIDSHVLQYKERADYATHLLDRLAGDLGMSRTELSYMLQFARAYPIFPRGEKLSWSGYRALLTVNVPEERTALAERAVKENWNRDRIRQEVRTVSRGTKSTDTPPELKTLPLSAPGKPGTYKVILAKVSQSTEPTLCSDFAVLAYQRKYGPLALDLGFSNYVSLSSVIPKKKADTLKEGDIVGSASPNDLFSYEAYVYRVLDGDTVEAVVDLGFGFATQQVLRLRGIDAPELATRDGMSAKEALEKMLAQSSRVLIRSTKSDKYDRYLADVYGVDAQGSVVYINNKLLEGEYAVRVYE